MIDDDEETTEFVYFIQVGKCGPIKIGHSIDPERRRTVLQQAHTEKLCLIHTEVGGPQREAKLHRKFAAARLRGEWFEPVALFDHYIIEHRAHVKQEQVRQRVEQARREAQTEAMRRGLIEAKRVDVAVQAINTDPRLKRCLEALTGAVAAAQVFGKRFRTLRRRGLIIRIGGTPARWGLADFGKTVLNKALFNEIANEVDNSLFPQ